MKTLAEYLKYRSKEICADNHCAEGLNGEHNCESYAYIDSNGKLLDICISDYFQGASPPYAAILLPWNGTEEELMDEVAKQYEDFEGDHND